MMSNTRANNDPASIDDSGSQMPDNSARGLFVRVESRFIYGWMDHAEALISKNLDGKLDDASIEINTQTFELMKEAVAARPTYKAESPIVVSSKKWDTTAIKNRPDLKPLLQGLKWSAEVVDLNKILAFQKSVRLPGLKGDTDKPSAEEILPICLPVNRISPYTYNLDGDAKGLTLSSFDPNFRALGIYLGPATVQTNPNVPAVELEQAVIMNFGAPVSHLHVAKYKGRYFLRDGYHRAVSLLRLGITDVPCIVIEANSLKEVYSAAGNFLGEEVLMGPRPPLIGDFLDNDVSGVGETNEMRKIVRIREDEFMVYS
jgi:hypothetical protein